MVRRPWADGPSDSEQTWRMMSGSKKWIRFSVVFAVWLVADLWSKHWADVSLAGPRHPLPIAIGDDEVGRPLGDVLKGRLGWESQEIERNLPLVQKLAPAATWRAEDKPFAKDSPAAGVGALWVFWRDDQGLSPRRFDLIDRRLLVDWLTLAHPKTDRAEVVGVAQEGAAELTFADLLPAMFRKLDAAIVARLFAEGRIHPAVQGGGFTMSTPVAAGETYLVLDHQIDVMGDWWKFTYAENPGAAFGFLKGLSPDVRHWVFMLLTLVAFIVIGSIVYRLPAEGWLVLTAFAGILSGAVGNFVDRIRYGFVIDFIDMDLGFMHWPTYNVADIAISLGVIALMVDLTFNKNSVLAQKKPTEATEKA
jgi:signal peptidase II